MDLLAGHELVNKNGSRVLANHALKVEEDESCIKIFLE